MSSYRYLLIVILITLFSCGETTEQKNVPEKFTSVDAYFESIKNDSVKLAAFFRMMPKGGDLHHHASGAVYAEVYIQNAINDHLMIDTTTFTLLPSDTIGENIVSIKDFVALKGNRELIIDEWSIRTHIKKDNSDREKFLASFDKFDLAFVNHEADNINTLIDTARRENVQYLETMIRVKNVQTKMDQLSKKLKWNDQKSLNENLDACYDVYRNNGLESIVMENVDSLHSFHGDIDQEGVLVRFQTFAIRVLDWRMVFGQLVLGFESSLESPLLIGVNIVAPENNILALKDYKLHMQMIGYLHHKYPEVNISLHAGELVSDLDNVSEEDLSFHIADAVKIAGAERIGHGVDLLQEVDSDLLIRLLDSLNINVEINFESNEVLLETTPEDHPFMVYLTAGVPVSISTDYPGVLRSNLTNQYIHLLKYNPNITYSEVKELVVNSVMSSFLDQGTKFLLKENVLHRFTAFEKKILE